MAGVQPGTDATALGRARAILVQTATFGLTANEYEAESNGNFDEVAVTAANDEKASVYVFEYRDGASSRQVPPARMPSLKTAREEAVRCAVDLLADLQSDTELSEWLIRVRGEDGTLLHTVDLQEANALRHESESAYLGMLARHMKGFRSPSPRKWWAEESSTV